jgi:polyisoprenoid-binding protein YceI
LFGQPERVFFDGDVVAEADNIRDGYRKEQFAMRALGISSLALAVSLYIGPVALPNQAPEKKTATSATYEVDSEGSRIYMKVGTATRLGHEHGVEGNLKSGKLTLGSGGELVFDMASFTADTAEARKRVGLARKKISKNEAKKVTATMRGGDVLNVTKYPIATFRISSITPLDKQAAGEPGAYQVEGRFTLHSTEQRLLFKASVEAPDKQGRIRISGTFTIRQTDYGIKPYSGAGGLAKVADELEISGDLVLKPTSGK